MGTRFDVADFLFSLEYDKYIVGLNEKADSFRKTIGSDEMQSPCTYKTESSA